MSASYPLQNPEEFLLRAKAIIFGNSPTLHFPLDGTVAYMHQQWGHYSHRAGRIASYLRRGAQERTRQLKQLEKRDPKKKELREEVENLESLARTVCHLADRVCEDAQQELATALKAAFPKVAQAHDEDFHEEYFDAIGSRPGIEHTWKMSLREVAHLLLGIPYQRTLSLS